ncbi:MAG: hypothetical protein GY765_32365, partial [bacterium]|nr:hypothetical protein [bacterium]
DVEQQFPTYPKDYQAGWGYMMLTNMLPNDGNGTFTIYAKATDTEGNEIMLGSKTIICDNANAVKPFGAIDTPEQGGTASGSSYINFGWALTPQPNTIPIDGSSIEVWVDGVPLGNPVYNQYREDIATRFPGYNNSDGAVGYFYMDTASYLNGVHTIAWSVKDDAGNTDGIGSRYFTVVNSGTNGSNARRGNANGLRVPETTPFPPSQVRILEPSIEPVILTKGFAEKSAVLYSNPDGAFHIEARETERIEIQFGNSGSSGSVVSGYLLQGDQYRFLPVGSTIDSLRNIFYWQPGPGFYGNYTLVFVEEDSRGRMTRKLVQVNITAKK